MIAVYFFDDRPPLATYEATDMKCSEAQITALLSKYEAVIKRQAAEKKELELQLAKKNKALKDIRFITEDPVGLTERKQIHQVCNLALTEDQRKS